MAGAPTTVILCAYRNVVTETMESIEFLRDLGWGYRVGRGDALIERVRSREVSRWYKSTDEDVFLMVDDDVVFTPEHAQKVVDLAREKRSIVVGAYPVKDGTHLACRGFPGQTLTFGPVAPPVEIAMPATGFMAVHRDVLTAMINATQRDDPSNAAYARLIDGLGDSEAVQDARAALDAPLVPLCYGADDEKMHWWPFFYAFWITGQRGDIEPLSEDYAFGERARWLGFKVWLDQSVELYHLGQYPYTIQNMHGPGVTHHDVIGEPVEIPNGMHLYVDPNDSVIGTALRRGVEWESDVSRAIWSASGPEKKLLDLGAHVGYQTVLAAKHYGSVLAVEPNPDSAQYLRRNLELNDIHNVTVAQVAVSDHDGIARLLRGTHSGAARLTTSDDLLGLDVRTVTLQTLLDEYDFHPDVMKVDIEGADYLALAGGIPRSVELLVAEYCEGQLEQVSGVSGRTFLELLEREGFAMRQEAAGVVTSETPMPGGYKYLNLICERVKVLA